ncbi:MAG: calcium-binding protein, partial [Planctomycetaceae bacterium]
EVLRESIDRAEWFGYLEDDLWIADALWLEKLAWFQSIAGEDALLLPNRFERSDGPLAAKAYVDGNLAKRVTTAYQDLDDRAELIASCMDREVRFVRARNPHAGCYFVTQTQLRSWMSQPSFNDRDAAFIGPLESAATLGIMRTFRIYKPAIENAGFFEIEHQSNQFISQLRRPPT